LAADRCGSDSFDPQLVKIALSLARRFGAHHQDVEDIGQEALLKLLTYRDTIQNPEAWLFVVVGRLVRRYANRPRIAEHLPVSLDPWPEIDLVLDAKHLLTGLSVRERRALLLSFAGFTERETAARLGCSIKATEKSLHQARRAVRKSLAAS
jgi:RNA polymerase sigma factor (sigma-70 family)